MFYNPSYMNPIMKGLNQGQPQQQEPLEGIASLAPTQPSQPLDPQMTPPLGGIQPIQPLDPANPTGDALVHQIQMRMQQQDVKPPAWNAYAKDVMDTGGYPTKTIQEYYNQFGDNSLQPLPFNPSNPVLGGVQTPPVLDGQKSLPFDIAPITPYQQNENLDLTDRTGIMSEYNKYLQGGLGSNVHTADMATGYSFMGEEMGPGSSTGFGDFRKFLDTYGIGDRLQRDTSSFGAQPLQQMEGIQGLAAYQSQQNTGPGI